MAAQINLKPIITSKAGIDLFNEAITNYAKRHFILNTVYIKELPLQNVYQHNKFLKLKENDRSKYFRSRAKLL